MREMVVDIFAGGGGASEGISQAIGRQVDVAINHDKAAIRMHAANHPKTRHYTEDVWKAKPRAVTGGRPVGLLWASPDCKHFSRAKGGKPVEKHIRSLAWVVCRWAADVKPRTIFLENVREFKDWGPLIHRWRCANCGWKGVEKNAKLHPAKYNARLTEIHLQNGVKKCRASDVKLDRNKKGELVLIPDPERKGLTFRRFVGRLRNLGYTVDHSVVNAAVYGAKTNRRRLVLIARRDEREIVWAKPTHGDPKKGDLAAMGLKPFGVAAECIDWDLPVPSIFMTGEDARSQGLNIKRPLADATLRRIAHGVKRYVIDNPNPYIPPIPFIMGVGGRMAQTLPAGVDQPQNTITAKNDRAVCVPCLMPLTHHGERKGSEISEPLPTVTAAHRGEQAIIASTLIRYNGDEGREANSHDLEKPLNTIPTENRFGLVAATLVQTGYGEREGQAPRTLDLGKPMGTAVAGVKQGLVAAFLSKYYGESIGSGVDAPLGTTTRENKDALIAANLVHFNHGGKQDSAADEPMRTVMSRGLHAALVYSFLVKYFGESIGQSVDDPMGTATTKDRFGLVIVHVAGEPYVIVDIGLRMLQPRELARGQSFPEHYILTGTKTSQVARIGNSVPPPLARAMVAANYP